MIYRIPCFYIGLGANQKLRHLQMTVGASPNERSVSLKKSVLLHALTRSTATCSHSKHMHAIFYRSTNTPYVSTHRSYKPACCDTKIHKIFNTMSLIQRSLCQSHEPLQQALGWLILKLCVLGTLPRHLTMDICKYMKYILHRLHTVKLRFVYMTFRFAFKNEMSQRTERSKLDKELLSCSFSGFLPQR